MLEQLDITRIDEVAAIHRLAFPESAWTRLGGRVVEEYYLWQLTGPHPIVRAVGISMEDSLVGFCISGVFRGSTSGFLKKNRRLLLKRLVARPWLVLDPVFFGKLKSGVQILNRFRKKDLNKKARPERAEDKSFGILAIAVDPSRQGLGLGQLLMADAEKAAVELEFSKMNLTVKPTNYTAVRFYEKLNWERLVEKGIWNGAMTKTLKERVDSIR